MVTFLVKKGAQIKMCTTDCGRSPLHCAVLHKRVKNIQCLLEAQASLVNTPNNRNYTPLQWAIKHWCKKQQSEKHHRQHKKHVQIIDLLLKAGAQPEDTYYLDGSSNYPIHVSYVYTK